MEHIPRLSEAVYVGLCHEVGSTTEVRFRREVMDTEEFVEKPVYNMEGLERVVSGSRREGFRLKISDVDFMIWHIDHKVICDYSQISLYRIPQHTVILMECDNIPPGFAKLNLKSPTKDKNIRSSCVTKNNKIYIHGGLFRERHLQIFQSGHAVFAYSTTHGPCSSYFKEQYAEFDYLVCLRSHHWPTTALPWLQRCHQQGWPSENVLSEILSRGFHVVPIGSTSENDLEWRISFSQAEQKLVYSMNHCQFLCYGLLKYFLKEVINSQNSSSVLCSYFMKTILFWVIQINNSFPWKADNLLFYFWKCFQFLICCVRIGECPNFFIPQNNMFRVKVTGSVQASLFRQLHELYDKGISCLLLSETLRPFLNKVILNRTLNVCTEERIIIKSTDLNVRFFHELKTVDCIFSFKVFAVYMNQIDRLIRERLTPYQLAKLQCMTSGILRNTALIMQNGTYSNKNRPVYSNISKVYAMVKNSCRIGCVSDILYFAIYFYRTRRHESSLSILHKAQERISVPYIVYMNYVIRDMYEYYMAELSLDKKIRRALVVDIKLNNNFTDINELVMEQMISKKNGWPVLRIPPLVMLHMLCILNHHRLGDTVRSQQSLQDLQTLLLYDDGVNVPIPIRDISWQILGICQQITGDYSGSLQSYRYSLKQVPLHKIREATLVRMNTLSHGAQY